MSYWLQVVVATPAHSAIAGPLTYSSESLLSPGTLVRVPLGKREVLGVVWSVLPDSGELAEAQTVTPTLLASRSSLPPEGAVSPWGDPAVKTRPIISVLDGLAPLSATWRKLVMFTAGYYQRSLGEVALAALPPQLRELSTLQLARRLKRPVVDTSNPENTTDLIALSVDQTRVLAEFDAENFGAQRPALLFGATGSGKTEVYLRAAARVLAQDPRAQVLVMVPEINLTPQLQARIEARFAHLGQERVVSLHSGLTPAQRLKGWLAAHAGQARLVLGTRMAVLASMPHLRLLVVDEEHDPSYKQQEGARYSARDLAVYRARLETGDARHPHGACRVLLGSATPSLESWQATITGRYQRLTMNDRIGSTAAITDADNVRSAGPPQASTAASGGSVLHAVKSAGANGFPDVRRVDMNRQPKHCVIAPPLLAAISERVAHGEQSLIFLNRRGYAPVLACHDCGWKSECPHCSAFRVFHKIDRTLRCHHCGFTERVPRACPNCGNIDIAPVGRGTERLEEHLAELLADVKRPDGTAVRLARIDADTTRLKGALESQLASVHAGEVDVLVGTQMIAKGHDFRRITLVAAINPDSALFSSDFRAPERLFSLLMQAAGRAGRDARRSEASEMWVQTFHPAHPLFAALRAHDYPAFAQAQLQERAQSGLPPFSAQALVRAEARTQEVAQGFLAAASVAAHADLGQPQGWSDVLKQVALYPAVPMSIQRVANVERAQMLVESASRGALQRFLSGWQPVLHATRAQPTGKGLIRWAVDVNPLAI
ncbi:MAG: primosomal protein N' [Polaromonas sp.]|nr:primosomal protein N' [Polaromonas sp.]